MGTVVKRKIKIKKKNFAIFLLFLFLLVFGLTEIVICIGKAFTAPKKKPVEKPIKVITIEEKKLKQLNNINEKIDYFNLEYLDRYIAYKNKNEDLSLEQVIKNVNMQLDKEKYKDTIDSENLNTNKILVNKYYRVGEKYVPNNLETISARYALNGMKMVKEAKEAFESLSKDASKEGLNIIAMSTYRSYNYQVNLYNRYVKEDGKEKADTYSGRPGHSEHQTGLAVDVYNKKENYTNFEKTKEFKWMNEHAQDYGFILRFPKDKEEETGYIYESWHYRYVGIETAKYIKEHKISFEEYYATKIKDW